MLCEKSKRSCVIVVILFWSFTSISFWYTKNVALPQVTIALSPTIERRTQVQGNKHIPILCLSNLGQLGNQMFEFASAYGIAKKKGLRLVFEHNYQLLDVFNIPISYFKRPPNYCSNLPVISDRWHCSYDESVLKNISDDQDFHLKGFFQSWKYWNEYESDVRKLFTFKLQILARAKKCVSIIKDNVATVLVGIHVRRGDFLKESKVNSRTVATERYFKNAIQYFRVEYKKVTFAVVSDDFKWCKNVMGTEKDVHFMEGNDPAVDLAIMSLMDHTIISVGTFSWWGGWLSSGTTVYYKNIFKYISPFLPFRNNDTSEYVYPGWISMS